MTWCAKFVKPDQSIAFADFQRKSFKIRVVSAYFPHSGYSDKSIQAMYNILSETHRHARTKKLAYVVGADCNARVGQRATEDDRRTPGQYDFGSVNVRGQWLKNWAATEKLRIMNTFYHTHAHNLTTYTSPQKQQHQIDFILASKLVWKTATDCEATTDIDLGSDHKALRFTF